MAKRIHKPLELGVNGRANSARKNVQSTLVNVIQKHSRYLSEWEDDLVVINIAHHKATTLNTKTIDLAGIQLAVHGGLSIFKENVLLSNFPHLLLAVKNVINQSCEMHHRGVVDDQIARAINDCVRIFVWMMRRGMYRLSEVKKKDTQEFATQLSKDGWWKLLDYDLSLKRLAEEGRLVPTKMESLLGTGKLTVATVNCERLSAAVGLPIPKGAVPNFFMAELATYSSKGFNLRKHVGLLHVSETSLAHAKKVFNCLSNLPEGYDRLTFQPFPRTNNKASKSVSEEKVLFLGDAVKILQESLKWLYDYAPGVIDLCNLARQILENRIEQGFKDIRVENDITLEFDEIEKICGIPIQAIKMRLNRKQLIKKLVEMIQTAALCVIAFVHARRRGELADESRNYGLYFGCVRDEGAVNGLKKIDIYIEKSVQDYVDFWCNSLVADAVSVLEELSQCFRPLFSDIKKVENDISKARKDHLFTLRNFTVKGFGNSAECYRFSESIKDFLDSAGVPAHALNGAKAFRRLFAILYVHRYDHPVLLALKQHLCHTNLGTTSYYAQSPKVRKEAEEIEKLFKLQFREIDDAIKEVRGEYFCELLMRMLKGEAVGGAFPQFVNKVVKKISANIDFQNRTNIEKSRYVQDIFFKHGFSPYEMEHGACMAGESEAAIKRGKCCVEGRLHRETASPNTCHGCPNNLNTNNYLSLYETERERLIEESKNYNNSKSVRMEGARQAVEINKLILAEKAIAEKNREAFEGLSDKWTPIFMEKPIHEYA